MKEFTHKKDVDNFLGIAFLGHLSQNNNRPELAFATVTNMLKKSGVKFEVRMALRNIESDVVEI